MDWWQGLVASQARVPVSSRMDLKMVLVATETISMNEW
jgi:hypothetical protein